MAKPKFTIKPVQTARPVADTDRELLSKTADDGVYPLAMAKEIRLDRLRPDPDQPRRSFDEHRLSELAASIREQGILQPIVVEYLDIEDCFRIVHGERRYRAALVVGLHTIPAIVRRVEDGTRLARQLIENIQREDLNDVDRALALKQLKVNLGSPSWEVIAQKVGISKRRILQLIDTTKLPEVIQDAIRRGQLTEKHGRALKKLPPEQKIDFARTVQERGLSGDDSVALAQTIIANPAIGMEEAIARVKSGIKPAQALPTTVAVAPETKQVELPSDRPAGAQAGTPGQPVPPMGGETMLASLRAVSALLATMKPESAEPTVLAPLLREIIARAEELLRALEEPGALPAVPGKPSSASSEA